MQNMLASVTQYKAWMFISITVQGMVQGKAEAYLVCVISVVNGKLYIQPHLQPSNRRANPPAANAINQ